MSSLCSLTICMLHVSITFSVSVYLSICSPRSVYHNVCLTQCLHGPVLCSPMAVCATACVSLYNCMSQGVSQFLCVPMPMYLSVCIFQCWLDPLFVSQSVCASQCFLSVLVSVCLNACILLSVCPSIGMLLCVSEFQLLWALVSIPQFPCVSKVCVPQCVCVHLKFYVSLCVSQCLYVPAPVWQCQHPCMF